MTLDTNTANGKEIAGRLIKADELVVENYASQHLERWGITHEWTKEIKPAMIFIFSSVCGCSGH